MTDLRHVEFTRKAECAKKSLVLEVLEEVNKHFVQLVLKKKYLDTSKRNKCCE